MRARAQYKMEGEKPSRLFCSLEKLNSVQKYIPKLIVEANDQKRELIEQKSIENEIYMYYRDLFTEKTVEDASIEGFLTSDITCPKISESQKLKMEGMIPVEELTNYLKSTRNDVSPGSSGFSILVKI